MAALIVTEYLGIDLTRTLSLCGFRRAHRVLLKSWSYFIVSPSVKGSEYCWPDASSVTMMLTL